MKVIITAPRQYLSLKIENPFFDLVEEIVIRQTPRRLLENGTIEVTVTDYTLLTIPVLKAIMSVGGTIDGVPLFFEISAANYAGEVPEGIPYRTSVDEEGVETVLTWGEWKASNMSHGTAGGNYYVPGNSNMPGGEYINISDAVVLDGVAGYTILSEEDYRAVEFA